MTKHDPNRIHWNRVLRLIREEENAVAVYELAEKLKLKKGDNNLKAAIIQLINQGRIRMFLGKDKKGMVCRVVEEIKEDKSKRDMI